MRTDIKNFLTTNAQENFLPLQKEIEGTEIFHISFKEIEELALKEGIAPLRYKRNQETIDCEKQLQLLNAHVAIIGCGGLGGHIAEILTRVGVGKLTLFDFDIFEEHNLNRQNFSNMQTLGREKVLVVKEGIEKINPALEIEAHVKKFDPKKDFHLLQDCDVVVDALDSPQTKLDLSFVCKEKNRSFVHGAIAGMNGQFITCNTLENFYKDGTSGAESVIGNPAFSVTFAASIQSAEVVKLLLGIGETLQEEFLITNLLENEFLKL